MTTLNQSLLEAADIDCNGKQHLSAKAKDISESEEEKEIGQYVHFL